MVSAGSQLAPSSSTSAAIHAQPDSLFAYLRQLDQQLHLQSALQSAFYHDAQLANPSGRYQAVLEGESPRLRWAMQALVGYGLAARDLSQNILLHCFHTPCFSIPWKEWRTEESFTEAILFRPIDEILLTFLVVNHAYNHWTLPLHLESRLHACHDAIREHKLFNANSTKNLNEMILARLSTPTHPTYTLQHVSLKSFIGYGVMGSERGELFSRPSNVINASSRSTDDIKSWLIAHSITSPPPILFFPRRDNKPTFWDAGFSCASWPDIGVRASGILVEVDSFNHEAPTKILLSAFLSELGLEHIHGPRAVLSCQLTGTSANDAIHVPKFIEEIDWRSRYQNDTGVQPSLRYLQIVERGYCTSWHIDFLGTAQYFFVLKGIFHLIPPTGEVLKLYRAHIDQESDSWIPRNQIRRIILTEGQAMIVPGGYLHQVYTPVLSVCVSGNFLHDGNIPTHRARYMGDRRKIFKQGQGTVWIAMVCYKIRIGLKPSDQTGPDFRAQPPAEDVVALSKFLQSAASPSSAWRPLWEALPSHIKLKVNAFDSV